MSEDKEEMGYEFGHIPSYLIAKANEWYLQSQEDSRFKLKGALERLRKEQEKNLDRFIAYM